MRVRPPTPSGIPTAATDEADKEAQHLLTPREDEVMKLLAVGCTTREIAAALSVKGKTVRSYLCNIYRKLGARGQAEALVRWLSANGSAVTGIHDDRAGLAARRFPDRGPMRGGRIP